MKLSFRDAARLMRDLDDRLPAGVERLQALYPDAGRAFLIGVTGNPGAGKSTVVDALITHYRALGKTVGVVCIDPTSPFSGGAILGDRIRMQRHATDDGVFIRSVATRGHLGGLSRSTADIVTVMDAMGFDIVLVETVGVGQAEVDVVGATHACVVVTVPGLGDDIQAIKAGILEIADVLVVNKADREGADRTVRDLTYMLDLRAGKAREVEIVKTVAVRGDGIADLAGAIDRCRAKAGDLVIERRGMWARAQLGELIRDRVVAAAEASWPGGFEALVAEVAGRRLDPYAAVERLLAAVSAGPSR